MVRLKPFGCFRLFTQQLPEDGHRAVQIACRLLEDIGRRNFGILLVHTVLSIIRVMQDDQIRLQVHNNLRRRQAAVEVNQRNTSQLVLQVGLSLPVVRPLGDRLDAQHNQRILQIRGKNTLRHSFKRHFMIQLILHCEREDSLYRFSRLWLGRYHRRCSLCRRRRRLVVRSAIR
ncbi:hypothetical protein D3C73_889450 [compost metagenome]